MDSGSLACLPKVAVVYQETSRGMVLTRGRGQASFVGHFRLHAGTVLGVDRGEFVAVKAESPAMAASTRPEPSRGPSGNAQTAPCRVYVCASWRFTFPRPGLLRPPPRPRSP